MTGAHLTVESTAREMARAVRERQISARELLDLHLARIEERNGEVNAVVSLDAERARASAAAADESLAAGDPVGPLHGLPFAVKDTHLVAGWRTTFGSPLHADFVPDADTLAVERIRGAGVVLLGRTNVPEFAAGSHTFNTIFGTTRNPADLSRSAGGSSGGAAAALAAGMVPLADGSDMGGSLRNPASFCGVVGLRPSLGRVPDWPALNHWETLGVTGPMARTVGDVALLLSVMAGPDARAPQALGDPGATFASPEAAALQGLRVAWSVDLGGAFEVDHEVAALHEATGRVFTEPGRAAVRGVPRPARGRGHLPHPARLALLGGPRADAGREPGRLQAVPRGEHPGGGVADRRGRRARVPPADRAVASDARVLHVVRRARPAGLPGAAVPGGPGVPHRDQRSADELLPGLDALGVLHLRDRVPGDLGARGSHAATGFRSVCRSSARTARTCGCSRSLPASRPR